MTYSNKHKIISISAIIVSFAFIGVLTTFGTAKVSSADYMSPVQVKALSLANTFRKESGMSRLNWNDKLSKAAENKAKDMVINNYFDHVSPTGLKAWNFIRAEGYDYRYAGENLAIDFTNIDDAMKAWENSPSHLENLISNKYDEFGFAEIKNSNNSIVYVQMFGNEK